MTLRGVRVLVAGAGLAGLAAAHDLAALDADLTVVDARGRVGGRVWTIRDGFAETQHAEAGGDMIDEAQHEIRNLAEELGLRLTKILRTGFGYARLDDSGRPRIVQRQVRSGWDRLAHALEPWSRRYRLAEQRWDSPVSSALARQTVAQWLDEIGADDELRATAVGLRGFFLADPEELSLIALVDQFAGSDELPFGAMYRIEGGNDRLAAALTAPLGERIQLNTEVVAVSHRGSNVRATVRRGRTTSTITCDYVILALPAPLVRRIPITPGLPPQQHEAFARLAYGRATKSLLQFSRRFWRAPGRPRALGTSLPLGAFWEANEEQRGRPGILAFLAGGGASDLTQQMVAKAGLPALADALDWLGGSRSDLVAARQIVWEDDPWSRGGYAFFDPGFDASLRPWLARPCGRLFFAGEHTSMKWQGYMNGAVESGRRAVAELVDSR
jgi:monoamine oxidase